MTINTELGDYAAVSDLSHSASVWLETLFEISGSKLGYSVGYHSGMDILGMKTNRIRTKSGSEAD